MPELQTLDCRQPATGTLERVKYFNRMLLTAEDMRTDQDFVLQKLRRHNRFLHGWGVVCGLIVKAAPAPNQPWRVQITEGYGLGPFGDEIFVGQPVFLDLAGCGPGAATSPCEPDLLIDRGRAGGPVVFVAVKYAECRARPVLAMPGGCGCEDEACEYSRIRDSFSIECLADLPASHRPGDAPSLCDVISGKVFLTCPPCPTEPWLVLARVTLPAASGMALADTAIDNKPPIRRVLFSTALIQQQVIKCCCGGNHEPDPVEPPPPPREASLVVRKSGSFMRERERAFVDYEIQLTNLGPDPAMNVRIVDTLTGIGDEAIAGVTDFSISPAGSGTWDDQVPPEFVASIPQLNVGAAAAVVLRFRVVINFRALPNGGVLENTVVAKSDTPAGPQSVPKARIATEVRPG